MKGWKWAAIAGILGSPVILVLLGLAMAGASMGVTGNQPTPSPSAQSAPMPAALASIPHGGNVQPGEISLELYQAAAAKECPGRDIWAVVAAVGQIESTHGQSNLAGVHSGHNSAKAEGPMQFEPPTFYGWTDTKGHFHKGYGVDGDGDGRIDIYDPADAVYSATSLLCQDGAGLSQVQTDQALWDYSHNHEYVKEADKWITSFSQPSRSAPTPVFAVIPVASATAAPATQVVVQTDVPTPVPATQGGTCFKGPCGSSYCSFRAIWCNSPIDSYGDGWGGLTRECVSYVYWKRRQVGLQPYPDHWGNPGDEWPKRVDHRTNPQPGDIVVWGPHSNHQVSGQFGHVAYVEEVFADGSFRVSQFNYDVDGVPPGVYTEMTIRPGDRLMKGIGFISGHP